MDEDEFQRLLRMFPVVRSRDYRIDLDTSRQSTSRPPQDEKWQDAWEDPLEGDQKRTDNESAFDLHDAFWEKLKLVAERKVGPADAKRFCDAFQRVHRQLVRIINLEVYKELSLDAARSLVNSIGSSR